MECIVGGSPHVQSPTFTLCLHFAGLCPQSFTGVNALRTMVSPACCDGILTEQRRKPSTEGDLVEGHT